jgi:putative transposase
MSIHNSRYRRHRFPPEVISYAVWVYHRFTLSFRDVEDLLAERGVIVPYESIRRWCQKFGPGYYRKLKRREGRFGDIWHVDEVFVKIHGETHYLWRAVDQAGDVIEALVQRERDARAAKRFLTKAAKSQRRSYRPAARETLLTTRHDTEQYANNRAEVSHQRTRQRERQMRRFNDFMRSAFYRYTGGSTICSSTDGICFEQRIIDCFAPGRLMRGER